MKVNTRDKQINIYLFPLLVKSAGTIPTVNQMSIVTQIERDMATRAANKGCPQPNFDDSAVSSISCVDRSGMDRLLVDDSDKFDCQSMASDVSDACSLYEYCSSAKKENTR